MCNLTLTYLTYLTVNTLRHSYISYLMKILTQWCDKINYKTYLGTVNVISNDPSSAEGRVLITRIPFCLCKNDADIQVYLFKHFPDKDLK